MPKILDDCVKKVKAQIAKGELPKGSNAYAICIATLRKAGKIKKAPKGAKDRWRLAAKKAKSKAKKIRGKR